MFATFQSLNRQPRPAMPAATGATTAPRTEAEVLQPLAPQAITIEAGRDEEIVTQGEPAGYCYLVVSGCPGPVFQVQVIEDVDQVDRVIGPQLRGWAFTEGRSRRKRRQLAEQIQIRFALACLGLQIQPIALAGSRTIRGQSIEGSLRMGVGIRGKKLQKGLRLIAIRSMSFGDRACRGGCAVAGSSLVSHPTGD